MIYHVAMLKDRHDPRRVVVQMRRDRDCLDPEVWRYQGEYDTTKAVIRRKKLELLAAINLTYSTSFTRITID